MKKKVFSVIGVVAISVVMSFVVLIFVCSCINTTNLPRSELVFKKVIADDLYTTFPGNLRVTSNHIVLENPFDKDAFLQIYDRQTGKEILRTGTIGRGPGEWNSPRIGNVINDKIAVYDADLKQFIITEVNTMSNISISDSIQKTDLYLSKFVFLNKSHYIAAPWKETHPFEMFVNGQIIPCGQYPFKIKVINADCFQGIIQVHPQRKLLVYATFQNPYIAIYQIDEDSLKLIWENQFKLPQYSVVENQLRWGSEQPAGASDVAFTKDYIGHS